ncbi:50S ribosomal protein L11 methyltransferase [Desulfoluna limicola]|uniref:50S ribosomal protein L11 methyltransferase n=1 Tax=Desulfoluna limicola TaxID=2810562 RepID=A0ABM7PH17_9BACT|nr:hypothetical protein [Desulfoluna limicola]BCS96485.1 50S ribosomal protein L11 methyltransferase [Desulfoluna limicola]
MKLNNTEVQRVDYSIDEIGTIYFYKDKVLRAITKESLSWVNELLDSGLIDELVSKKLFPKTLKTDYLIEGYSLIIEHEKLSNWNHSYEWSFDMLKDISIAVIEINEISNKYGYELIDCHASNLIFHYNKPIYIDLGSFRKTDDVTVWSAKNIFLASYYVPLKLYSMGYINIAQNITLSPNYFSLAEFKKIEHPVVAGFIGLNNIKKIQYIQDKIYSILLSSEDKIRKKLRHKNIIYLRIALGIKKYLKCLSFNTEKAQLLIDKLNIYEEKSIWGDYQDCVIPKDSLRFNRILEIVNSLEGAESAIEFAGNQGKLSCYLLKNSKINSVIATDYDKNAVNKMYLSNKTTDNFLPLLINFVNPEGRAFDKKLVERIGADVSIALAVTHHLLLTQNYDLDYIFEMMSKFTNKYILIEFMPLGLYGGDLKTTPKVPDYYNLGWFKKHFLKHYDYILDEEIALNRHLFVGKIKEQLK